MSWLDGFGGAILMYGTLLDGCLQFLHGTRICFNLTYSNNAAKTLKKREEFFFHFFHPFIPVMASQCATKIPKWSFLRKPVKISYFARENGQKCATKNF